MNNLHCDGEQMNGIVQRVGLDTDCRAFSGSTPLWADWGCLLVRSIPISELISVSIQAAAALLILALFASPALAQITITANTPTYGFQTLAGSQRQISVNIASGATSPCGPGTTPSCVGTVNWAVAATTGGASATFTDPTHTAASSISGALPTILINMGTTVGTCSISGTLGGYSIPSTATVTVRATSTDDATKHADFVINACAPPPLTSGLFANGTSPVVVAPAYQQAYRSQPATLQSWVTGCVDESVTWSILSQPAGGDGALVDTNKRDTYLTAMVTGRYTVKATYSGANCYGGTVSNTAIVYVAPQSLPSYLATPNGTRPTPCYADPALTGSLYEVGSGYTYANPSAVPNWATWTPGSMERVHNTGGSSPSVYHNYMQVEISGTPAQPMIVCGVDDSGNGYLPILNGTNATTQSTTSPSLSGYGLLFTWPGPAGGHYNYWQSGSAGPSYVSISSLHFQNATPAQSLTLPGGGTTTWVDGNGCIYLGSGTYIDVVGVELDTCTNGLATYANGNNAWATITQAVSLRGSHMTNNGWNTEDGEHQVYNQSWYALIEGNLIDHALPTAQADAVKFRGIEAVFRYNYISTDIGASGPQRLLDWVEVQDASMYVSFEPYLSGPGQTDCNQSFWCLGDLGGAPVIASYQESAQKDWVYGNPMSNASGAAEFQIHYAEDHDGGMAAKNGQLNFYSNTIHQAEIIFDTGYNNTPNNMFLSQRVLAQNNIFWIPTQISFDSIEPLIFNGITNLTPTGTSITTPIVGGSYSGNTAFGWQAGCDYTCPWPLTNPLNPHIYNLSSGNYLTTSSQPYTSGTLVPGGGSPAIGAGTPLSGALASLPVRWQYDITTNSLTPRAVPLTLGAEDSSGTPTVATPSFSPPGATYTGTQTVTISTATGGASLVYTNDGSTPTVTALTCTITHGTLYSSALTVSTSQTIKAIGCLSGDNASSVGTAAYIINTPTPPQTVISGNAVGSGNFTIP